jgi:NADPH-dependent curcumin reductase CurA
MNGTKTYQHIKLVSRPYGKVTAGNFELATLPIPNPDKLARNDVLVRNLYLSIDPYMRGRMSSAKSYAAPQELEATMVGATVGVVVKSNFPNLREGDYVVGQLGWAEMGVANGNTLQQVNTKRAPLTAYLGVLGMPGVTAWYGVNVLLNAQPGQTLVVSAASGAVGGVVGQLAKLKGCHVVGIAGGEQKCEYVVKQLGFDACIDYKSASSDKEMQVLFSSKIPQGIDLLFENAGGRVFDASLGQLNPYAKIALCGMVAGYNGDAEPLRNAGKLLTMRASLQGFIITEHMKIWPQALKELTELVVDNKLQYRETISRGLASAPTALIGLLEGKNFGKQLVQIS